MWKDAAQGAVIQEGGQGAVCRNDAPGAVIWAHSYTAEPTQREPQLLGAGVRHSAHGKGHEEGGLTYAKAGAPDPGYSKERRHRRGSGNNCLIKR